MQPCDLVKLKPNAKATTILDGDWIRPVYLARLGRNPIKCIKTGKTVFETEEEAIAAATHFKERCRESLLHPTSPPAPEKETK